MVHPRTELLGQGGHNSRAFPFAQKIHLHLFARNLAQESNEPFFEPTVIQAANQMQDSNHKFAGCSNSKNRHRAGTALLGKSGGFIVAAKHKFIAPHFAAAGD